MKSDPSPRPDVAHRLGVLAMRFRRTRDATTRRAIASEYAQEVQRLIETGDWSEAPCLRGSIALGVDAEDVLCLLVPGRRALTRFEEVGSGE